MDRKQVVEPVSAVNSLSHLGVTVSSGKIGSSSLPIVNNTLQVKEKKEESEALSRLISMRARKQEIFNYVSLCSASLHKGPWSRVSKRYRLRGLSCVLMVFLF